MKSYLIHALKHHTVSRICWTLLSVLLSLISSSGYAGSTDPFGIAQALSGSPSSTSTMPTSTAAAPIVPMNSGAAPQMSTTAPVTPALPVPTIDTQPPQSYDYATNLKSDVFGANLFTGSFAREGATHFNPDYLVASGDYIQVRFWGAFEYDAPLNVDPQGNIFVPHVGPVHVLGVRNQDLQQIIETAVRNVFRANVYSYASLAAAQPVRVFVGGFVNRPGLYSGTSMDSLLHYLDQAGGIDVDRGSFISVQVKRGNYTPCHLKPVRFYLARQNAGHSTG